MASYVIHIENRLARMRGQIILSSVTPIVRQYVQSVSQIQRFPVCRHDGHAVLVFLLVFRVLSNPTKYLAICVHPI